MFKKRKEKGVIMTHLPYWLLTPYLCWLCLYSSPLRQEDLGKDRKTSKSAQLNHIKATSEDTRGNQKKVCRCRSCQSDNSWRCSFQAGYSSHFYKKKNRKSVGKHNHLAVNATWSAWTLELEHGYKQERALNCIKFHLTCTLGVCKPHFHYIAFGLEFARWADSLGLFWHILRGIIPKHVEPESPRRCSFDFLEASSTCWLFSK